MQSWTKVIIIYAIVYADLERLLHKMRSCQNNPEKSYTEKELSIRLLVIHFLQVVYLIQQKISRTVIKMKTVWKGFPKT